MVRAAVRNGLEGHEKEVEAAVEDAFGKVIDSLSSGFVPGDVSAEQAQRILHGLEEGGLLVPSGRVEAMAEEIARERLRALLSSCTRPRTAFQRMVAEVPPADQPFVVRSMTTLAPSRISERCGGRCRRTS